MPFEAEDIIEDLGNGKKEDSDQHIEVDPVGMSIEQELEALYSTGKKSYSIDELADKTNKTYDVLFDNYEDDEENGIVTTKYSLIETKDGSFTLKLN
jgi:hypothetical protein